VTPIVRTLAGLVAIVWMLRPGVAFALDPAKALTQ
jgi:hypothetical protein